MRSAADDYPDSRFLLAEYDAAVATAWDPTRAENAAYMSKYEQAAANAQATRLTAAERFVELYPSHARAEELLIDATFKRYFADHNAVATVDLQGEAFNQASAKASAEFRRKIADRLAAGNDPPNLRRGLRHADLLIRLVWQRPFPKNEEIEADLLPVIEAMRRDDPAGERPRWLLGFAATRATGDVKRQILRQIAEGYPDTPEGKSAAGELRQLDAVGKPFTFAFDDVRTGERVTSESLKGKVLVVDFWATWCGPCVGDMPEMKRLHDTYKDQGVEFVGVSLDVPEAEGGRDALLRYLAADPLPWPQWYQGNGWASAFSQSWGVSGIPALFVVDAAGNLRETAGRGKLDEILPRLIAERDGPGNAAPPPATRRADADAPASADALLADYDAAVPPPYDPARSADEAYLSDWREQEIEARRRRVGAALRLAREHPEHPRVEEVLADGLWLNAYERGRTAGEGQSDAEQMKAFAAARAGARREIAAWLAEPGLTPGVRRALLYSDMRIRLLRERPITNEAIADMLPAIDALRDEDPKGARPRELLMYAAMYSKGEQRTALLRRLATEEGDTPDGKWAAGALWQAQAVGRPFAFAFDDVRTGERITSESLKGKVVVVVFWGTWCGVCHGMEPELKAVHAKYRGGGVAFVGVAVEDPAKGDMRTAVAKYVEEHAIPWPQWYLEGGWDSEVSLAWGVVGLPQIFIVDADGILRSLMGRPDEDLHALVPQLVAERNAKAGTTRPAR